MPYKTKHIALEVYLHAPDGNGNEIRERALEALRQEFREVSEDIEVNVTAVNQRWVDK